MKRRCAWLILLLMLTAVLPHAFAAETTPWSLAGEQTRREDLGKVQRTLDETARQLDEARREADSYERTWFGLYRKK